MAGAGGAGPRAVVIVEGASDRAALEALARRRGRDLAAEGVAVVAAGGAHAIGRRLAPLVAAGVAVAGLYDAGEEAEVRRALEAAGLGSGLTRAELAACGFHACVEDLEDELIRALGVAAVETAVEARGELGSFRTLQKQPAWRGRPAAEQLRRFLGSGGSRKIEYAGVLVEALDLDRVPRPLDAVLGDV